MSLASSESKPAAAPRSSVQVASAAPTGGSGGIGGFFGNLFGSKSEEQPAEPRGRRPSPESQVRGRSRRRPPPPRHPPPRSSRRRSRPEPKTAMRPRASRRRARSQEASAEPPSKPTNNHEPAQRRGADRAVRRLREPLRRLALDPSADIAGLRRKARAESIIAGCGYAIPSSLAYARAPEYHRG